MSPNMSRLLCVLGVLTTSLPAASAQYYGGYGNNPCACVTPVAQSCYQTVPVTEYRQVKQVVQRPVVETKYVDREVTEYRPVTETRTAQVPTVSYSNVTECQTVQRDASYWMTQYQQNYKPSPCEYDPRPGLRGWWNRTGYNLRSMFTPRVTARRVYVPRTVAQTIPVTRQVAHHGTREVSYQVTKMVPYTTTRKVAVNTVRYVAEEVTRTQPVTVMRTVPIGSSVAFATTPLGGSTTSTALNPSPDPLSSAASRTANRTNDYEQPSVVTPPGNRFKRTTPPAKKADGGAEPFGDSFKDGERFNSIEPTPAQPAASASITVPVRQRAGAKRRATRPQDGWTARQAATISATAGPALVNPTVSVVQAH